MRINSWDWYRDAWRNYFNFKGRSSRAGYWYFCLVHLIVFCLFLILDIGAQLADVPVFTIYYALAAIIPGLSLTVRGLHDKDRSGWWLLVGAAPLPIAVAASNTKHRPTRISDMSYLLFERR